MYVYTLELTPAKKYETMDYTSFTEIFNEARHYINKGLSYTRDGKELHVKEINTDNLIVILKSTNSLQNPTRSLSALTRFLTTNYSNIFKEYVYNKTLFSMKLLESNCIYSNDSSYISDEEMLKAIIDLLYAFTAKSVSDTQNRKKTIDQMKELIRPYMK